MKTQNRSLVISAASFLCFLSVSEALAEQAPTTLSVKVGYFNLGLVKASFSEAANAEAIRARAEAQLREDVDNSIQRLKKMQEEKKPAEEIQKTQRELQLIVSAKQEALAQLVDAASQSVKAKIAQVALAVAKEKGLDIVVDGQGIFVGGDKFLNSGIDVTTEMLKKLGPQSAAAPGATTSGAAKKP
ncbi:MAG TPA: OmpH family outer membrane protein [Candidatus Obscuribacterales bacterium]